MLAEDLAQLRSAATVKLERLATIIGLAATLIAGAIAYGRLTQKVDDLRDIMQVQHSHLQSWIDDLKARR